MQKLNSDPQKMLDVTGLCPECYGTGTAYKDGVARLCELCRQRRAEERATRLLELRPKRYRKVTLTGLEPRPDLHVDQPRIIEYMRANPFDNYFFCGDNDVGKTHLLHALYAHVVMDGRRRVYYTTLQDLIDKIKEGFNRGGDMQHDWIKIAQYAQPGVSWSVFLDDIDKARPTEFVGEVVFQLIDTIYSNEHQLVVTSQLDPENEVNGRESLIEHFKNCDPRYGLGIVRRIINDETNVWRMFK